MNDREIKLECLKLANSTDYTDSVVKRAAAFSEFVLGKKPAQEKPAPDKDH